MVPEDLAIGAGAWQPCKAKEGTRGAMYLRPYQEQGQRRCVPGPVQVETRVETGAEAWIEKSCAERTDYEAG